MSGRKSTFPPQGKSKVKTQDHLAAWAELNELAHSAKLTADGAMGHLYHFCALLPRQPYVDLRPAFAVTQDPLTELFTTTVTLPNCINPSARQASGCGRWKTRKAALQDAALQA
jgi:hypothetical protein